MSGSEFNADRVKRSFKNSRKILIIAVVALFVIIFLGTSFTVIDEGFIGVKYQFGKIVADDLSAGLNFKLPFIQTVASVDVREQMYQMDTNAYTKDTQTVENIKIKINYMYDRSKMSELIRNIGIDNVETKLLIPQIQSIMKNEIGQFRAEELVQNRALVQENIEDKMRDSLASNGIVVVSFAIENLDFEDGFEEAIRAKVVAEQDALRMQNKTAEKEEEAKQQVIAAQAEADSTKLKADAEAYAIEVINEQLRNSQGYIDFKMIEKWDGKMPQVMGEGVGAFVSITGE